jgi:hypothetical protein
MDDVLREAKAVRPSQTLAIRQRIALSLTDKWW